MEGTYNNTKKFICLWNSILLKDIKTIKTMNFILDENYFSLVIFLAGLQGIPIELVEAAKIDGADNFKIIRYITIPLLRGTTGLILALTTISGVKVFDYVFIMTMGGPAHSTEVLGSYLFQKGFILNKMGEASAIAVILMLIALVCAIFLFRVIATKES